MIARNPCECYHSFHGFLLKKVRKMLATMTSKGQITIPKPARDALQLHPGDRVEFVFGDDGRLFLLSATRPLESLKGMLPKPARAVSLEDMDNAIAASARP
jgi:AbrB family looped-hinge helix DNA binding protein